MAREPEPERPAASGVGARRARRRRRNHADPAAAMKPLCTQRGAAIIVAMLIVAMAAAAAASLLQQQDLALRQLTTSRDYEQAAWPSHHAVHCHCLGGPATN